MLGQGNIRVAQYLTAEMGREAERRGLTPEILDQLLNDDDSATISLH